jgi:deoxyribonuclease V
MATLPREQMKLDREPLGLVAVGADQADVDLVLVDGLRHHVHPRAQEFDQIGQEVRLADSDSHAAAVESCARRWAQPHHEPQSAGRQSPGRGFVRTGGPAQGQNSLVSTWPESPEALALLQEELASRPVTLWRPSGRFAVGGCFVCFSQARPGPGHAGDFGWAGAAVGPLTAVAIGPAPAVYEPGLLALREGPLLEQAVRALGEVPDALLVNATGRDHPRRAGLALHLGAVLGVPTVGVTHRPLQASGDWPADERGSTSPLLLEGELVGYWLRTRRGARPVAVDAAWRTGPQVAVEVVLGATERSRTPEPIRLARTAARTTRAESG